MREIKLQDLKAKSPTEMLSFAEEQQVENASTMRKQELMFAVLKQLASNEIEIIGEGVVEVLPHVGLEQRVQEQLRALGVGVLELHDREARVLESLARVLARVRAFQGCYSDVTRMLPKRLLGCY